MYLEYRYSVFTLNGLYKQGNTCTGRCLFGVVIEKLYSLVERRAQDNSQIALGLHSGCIRN